MRFPKLKLVRNGEEIRAIAIRVETKEFFAYDLKTKVIVGAATSRHLFLNLDNLRKKRHLLKFPQTMLHEFLHFFFFRYLKIHLIIHRIHDKTRGLVL